MIFVKHTRIIGLALGLTSCVLGAHTMQSTPSHEGSSSGLQAPVQKTSEKQLIAMLPASPMCKYLRARCESGDGKACEAYFARC
jgi:hypothetical protein